MAIIEVAKLPEHVDEDQLELIQGGIADHSDATYNWESEEDGHVIEANIDDDVFIDFRDRLEANDLNADYYVPIEFEDVFEVGDLRIASTYALELVLSSLREDFFVEDPFASDGEMSGLDDDEFAEPLEDEGEGLYSEEDGGSEMKDEQLRHVWRLMHAAVRESLDSNLSILLID